MKDHVEDFRGNQRDDLGHSMALKEFDRALFQFPFRIVDYVRNGKDPAEVVRRANLAWGEMNGVIARLLREVIEEAQAVIDDPNSTSTEKKAARKLINRAMPNPKCTWPQYWEPVLGRCVDP